MEEEGLGMKRLAKYFVEGMIYVIPIVVTALIVYKLFVVIDRPLAGVFGSRGVSFLVTVASVAAIFTVTGFLCSNYLTRRWMTFLDEQFNRFPLIKLMHSSLKDLIGAFVGDKKKFDRPVVVTLVPGSETKVIGFITRDSLASWGLDGHMAVYLPQSYNFAGNLIVVPAERVIPLDAPSGDVMAFVVSGGITGGRGDADAATTDEGRSPEAGQG